MGERYMLMQHEESEIDRLVYSIRAASAGEWGVFFKVRCVLLWT